MEKLHIEFPPLTKKNADTYLKFALNNFILSGAKVTLNKNLSLCSTKPPGCVAFMVKINGKLAIIDLQDAYDEYLWNRNLTRSASRIYKPENLDMPIFKVCMRPDREYQSNIFPYGPFQVWNNKTTADLEKFLSYGNDYDPHINNNIINTTSSMFPGTRKRAYSKLDYNIIYKDIRFIRNRVQQYQHWDRLSNCLGVLNISGSNVNVVDKAPIEAMWRGVCVIHNDIDILLPHNKQLVKNEHYICLADDYSDINEKINYLYDNRNLAKEMGAEARELMLTTSTPKRRTEWMVQVIEEYYN